MNLFFIQARTAESESLDWFVIAGTAWEAVNIWRQIDTVAAFAPVDFDQVRALPFATVTGPARAVAWEEMIDEAEKA